MVVAAAAVEGGLLRPDVGQGRLAVAPPAPATRAATACHRFASPRGDDKRAGTRAQPFRTVSRLVAALRPGQRGCLLAGVYQEDVTIRQGGRPGAPITLTAATGVRATLVGRLWIADTANDVVVERLFLDGRNPRNLPSPTVNGDRIEFLGNNVTNGHTGICFILGSARYGVAQDVLIEGNRVHDCGQLPPMNHDHGIYVAFSRNVVIRNNRIFANADRGIQLFPSAQNTLIDGNVIDGNGEGVIFSGDATNASSNNVVVNNVISNSLVRFNVESYWEGPVGTGNLVRNNCLWNGARGNIQPGQRGFLVEENLIADPEFVNRDAKIFRLQPQSKCAPVLAAAGRTLR